MKSFIVKTVKRLRSDEKGLTLVEYGIGLSIALAVAVTALSALGTRIEGQMTSATTAMTP